MGLLEDILDREGTSFYQINYRWQPKELLPVALAKRLLSGIEERYQTLEAATGELQNLTKADQYFKLSRKMRIALRRAKFSWRADDRVFLSSIAEFFEDYGKVLQMLKIDQARGRLEEET